LIDLAKSSYEVLPTFSYLTRVRVKQWFACTDLPRYCMS